MNVQDRIEAAKRSAIPARLTRGAEVLGVLWRSGVRCEGGWPFGCCERETEFCAAKKKWIALYLELGTAGRPAPDHPFGVIEAMSVRQFEATGITVRVELPGALVPLLIGPKGTVWKTVSDLAAIEDVVDRQLALDAVMRIQAAGL